MKKLALLIMVKNEHARISVTLDSVKEWVDCIVVLDTGSEDDTINIIREYCDKNNITLYLESQTFPHPFHFSNARNALLKFAEDKAEYFLMLDCNDELRGGDILKQFINNYTGESIGFHLCQEWWSGCSLDKYYNIRLIKNGHNWEYKNAIHEYITTPEIKTNPNAISRIVGGVTIYQDRTQDDDKSLKRFSRDEEIFEAEYNSTDTPDTRTVFYYGQTLMCLNKHEKAYIINKRRSEMEGFNEEKYHAYFRCGELSQILGQEWEISLNWYIKAYEYSSKIFDCPRAEPLFKIAEYYRNKNWEMSFLYLRRCCDLTIPENSVLFIDRRVYDYYRWHLMGIVGYYCKQYNAGKIGCARAYLAEKRDIDRQNLKHYIENEDQIDNIINTVKLLPQSVVDTALNIVPSQPAIQHPVVPVKPATTTTKDAIRQRLESMKMNRRKK
jgi:glycosyltransferase involved in cell wall biosynthesis